MKNNKIYILIGVFLALSGCSTSKTFESSYNYSDQATTQMVLKSPNISSIHWPPFFTGVAFIHIYDANSICRKKKTIFGQGYRAGEPIGKVYVNRRQRVKSGEIPVGKIVARVGMQGGVICGKWYSFETKDAKNYEFEVRESRPLITHCKLSVKERDSSGSYYEIESLKVSSDLPKLCSS